MFVRAGGIDLIWGSSINPVEIPLLEEGFIELIQILVLCICTDYLRVIFIVAKFLQKDIFPKIEDHIFVKKRYKIYASR